MQYYENTLYTYKFIECISLLFFSIHFHLFSFECEKLLNAINLMTQKNFSTRSKFETRLLTQLSFTGGHSSFFGFLNTFVHIWMYSYYFLSALGPKVQRFLWWKKYLTTLQMVQFILVILHAFQLLFIECDYPKIFVWWIGMHAIMFYFLFRNFYNQTYEKKKSSPMALKKEIRESEKEKKNQNSSVNETIYANECKMATGYISDSGLRNRVFIDNRGFQK